MPPLDISALLHNKVIIAIVLLVLLALYQFITIKKPEWSISHLFVNRGSGRRTGGTPLLNSFTVDFTEIAAKGTIDPVIGRHDEVRRLAQVLARRNKNNAILVGPPGVGKTAIVEGLAQRIVQNEVPQTLMGKRVLALDVATLMSGTKYRGEFEKRAKQLVEEIIRSERSIILFIDEVHIVIQSQGTEGSVNFSDILKPALARGDLQMIGATTTDEYNAYIKTDPALARRFQPIDVDEPTQQEAIQILQGIKDKYREYHQVEFTDAAIEAAVVVTHKQITGRTLPDKAIDAVDEAASMVRVGHLEESVDIVLYHAALKKHPELAKVWKAIQELDERIRVQKDTKKRTSLIKKREALEAEMQKEGVLVVDASDIEAVVAEWKHQS